MAICHPRIGWGGSERKVFWGIEALKTDYAVSLITAGRFDLDQMNAYHGTDLRSSDFRLVQAPLPFFLKNNAGATAVRYALYQRFCSRVADQYDAMISAYGPCDFGVPAIHYISDFAWSDTIRKSLHPDHPGFIYRNHLIRKAYLSLGLLLHKPSGRLPFSSGDRIVSVSKWAAGVVCRYFNARSEVLYPPVPGPFFQVPDSRKEAGFVCLGRIAPEKRLEETIEILKRVREVHPELHLHVVGDMGNDAYGRMIQTRIRENEAWVHHEGKQVGADKARLLAAHRYGIHACRGDAYPGAVAEMVKSGCLVFAHRLGGQNEIIDHCLLMFDSIPDAVRKILAVLGNDALQRRLQAHLRKRAAFISTDIFMTRFKELVHRFVEERSCRRYQS